MRDALDSERGAAEPSEVGSYERPRRRARRPGRRGVLSAQSQPTDHRSIPIDVRADQVCEQSTPLADQLEQAAAGMIVFLIGPKMLRQRPDPLGEKRDL